MYKSFSSLSFGVLEALASGQVMFFGTCAACLLSVLVASEFTTSNAEGLLIICLAMVLSSFVVGSLLYAVTNFFEKALNYKIQYDKTGWEDHLAYEEVQRAWDALFYD